MSPPHTKILHVEDDPSLQRLVRAALEDLGRYAVDTAADGYRALELAAEAAPDLLLLDLNLPLIDGISTLRALRALPGLESIPAIFLTAVANDEVEQELRAMNVCEVLRKPFRPRLLVQAADRALGREQA